MNAEKYPLNETIEKKYRELTNKGKKLADFVLAHPQKAVFMTTRELAAAVDASEATVVRFVRQLSMSTYADFIQALREQIDSRLTLVDRGRMVHSHVRSEDAELERIMNQDIENIRALGKSIDLAEIREIRQLLKKSSSVHVIGSRLSYAPAYYLGWTLTKVRDNVHIYKGSDRTTIDQLIFTSQQAIIVIVATSRYPTELIKIGKLVKRLELKMILLSDSSSCPLVPLSDHVVIAPLKSIPFLGNPASLISLINYLAHTLAADMGEQLKKHQEKLEQAYLENDILFYH